MAIYIINVISIVFLGYLIISRKRVGKKIFMIYSFLQLTLLCGLRNEYIGTDTWGYIHLYFENVKRVDISSEFFKVFNREPGYYLFTKIISLFASDYTWLLIIISGVTILLVCLTLYKYSADPVLSIFIFITLRSYSFVFTGMRQGLALGICFFSYRYIKERRFIPFLACVILASTIHTSALVFLLAYFWCELEITAKKMLFVLLTMPCLILLRDPIYSLLNLVISNVGYLSSATSYRDGLSTSIVYSLVLCGGLILKNKILKKDNQNKYLFNMIILAIFFYVLGYLGDGLVRIAMYFGWFIILFIPEILSALADRKIRHIAYISLYIILFLQYIYLGPGAALVPYRFYWQ